MLSEVRQTNREGHTSEENGKLDFLLWRRFKVFSSSEDGWRDTMTRRHDRWSMTMMDQDWDGTVWERTMISDNGASTGRPLFSVSGAGCGDPNWKACRRVISVFCCWFFVYNLIQIKDNLKNILKRGKERRTKQTWWKWVISVAA